MRPEDVSEFELKVLKAIALPHWQRTISGNKMIARTAAARRLERKGYAGKAVDWYVTKKGQAVLDQDKADGTHPD